MASNFTYDQFEQEAKKSGLYDGFSTADLNLAKQNPDAGMSILKYKQDWQNAATDEARNQANQGAENIRSTYGNYTGGADGSQFNLNGTKTYQPSDTVQQAQNLLNQQLSQKPGAYQSQWQTQLNDVMNKILNREEFSYDLNGDALYQQYKDRYLQQGQMAMMDTMGQAAAMTGGYGNSYAQSVGQQAYQGYLQGLNDKIPELYQLALDKYNMEGDALLDQFSMLSAQEGQDYDRYRDTVADWQTERAWAQDNYNSERSFDYGQYRDQMSDEQWQAEFDEAMRQWAESFQYQQSRDQASDEQWQKEFEEAVRQWQASFDEDKRRYELENGTAGSSGGSGGSGGSSGSGGSGGGYTYTQNYDTAAYGKDTQTDKTPGSVETILNMQNELGTIPTKPTAVTVAADAAKYAANGASKSELAAYLKNAYNSGYINGTQYTNLIKKYNIGTR